jgi:DNA-binding NtrC family response regulator
LKARLLIVDDEPIVRTALQRLLEARGFAVRSAADGVGALQTAQVFAPEFLIVDYMLHGSMDGLAIASALQSTDPELRVIVISGYGSADLEARIASLAHARFLWKPFDTAALLSLIHSLGPTAPEGNA